jgi:hypothetical protein
MSILGGGGFRRVLVDALKRNEIKLPREDNPDLTEAEATGKAHYFKVRTPGLNLLTWGIRFKIRLYVGDLLLLLGVSSYRKRLVKCQFASNKTNLAFILNPMLECTLSRKYEL